MTRFRHIILLLLIAVFPIAGYAQASLEKIVTSLEKDKAAQTVVYSERRDPSSHKIVKSSRVITFSDSKLAARIIAAFKKERNKAVKYQASNTQNQAVYSISFDDGKGSTSRYSLIQQNHSSWVFSVSIGHNPHHESDNDSRWVTDDYSLIHWQNIGESDIEALAESLVDDIDGEVNQEIVEGLAALNPYNEERISDNYISTSTSISTSTTGNTSRTMRQCISSTSADGRTTTYIYY